MTVFNPHQIIQAMTGNGKGILAADESAGTIEKRFKSIKVESTPEKRQQYREIILTAPHIQNHIGGVILFDETLRQHTSEGTPFVALLKQRGIVPGIKVDQGLISFKNSPIEKVTNGLDGLSERLNEYQKLGAQFAKWRAVITIENETSPTLENIQESADRLAQYAKACLENNLVPIVEPEVLMDGNHNIDQCYAITQLALKTVFKALEDHHIDSASIILKPNMVVPGTDHPNRNKVSPQTIAEKTLDCFESALPTTLPAIAFLSGGQSGAEAINNLRAINHLGRKRNSPWRLSFSFGRALQRKALQAWAGKQENAASAQEKLLSACQASGLASQIQDHFPYKHS